MKLTDLFIRRPVIAIVVNLVILIAGIQAIRTLNVRQYPRSDIAVIRVATVYVGASADLVRGFISTPLERVRRIFTRRAGSIFERATEVLSGVFGPVFGREARMK